MDWELNQAFAQSDLSSGDGKCALGRIWIRVSTAAYVDGRGLPVLATVKADDYHISEAAVYCCEACYGEWDTWGEARAHVELDPCAVLAAR